MIKSETFRVISEAEHFKTLAPDVDLSNLKKASKHLRILSNPGLAAAIQEQIAEGLKSRRDRPWLEVFNEAQDRLIEVWTKFMASEVTKKVIDKKALTPREDRQFEELRSEVNEVLKYGFQVIIDHMLEPIQEDAKMHLKLDVWALAKGRPLRAEEIQEATREFEDEDKRRQEYRESIGERSFVTSYGASFVGTNIGCNDFLTVFANVDTIQGPVPATIEVEGRVVPVRVLRADGFIALRAKLSPILEALSIGSYSLAKYWSDSAFLMVICSNSPFTLAGYKFIESRPSEPWDISGGLENAAKRFGIETPGIGRRLIQASIALAKAYGIHTVRIATVLDAHGFYTKMGFVGPPGSTMTYEIPYAMISRFRMKPLG